MKNHKRWLFFKEAVAGSMSADLTRNSEVRPRAEDICAGIIEMLNTMTGELHPTDIGGKLCPLSLNMI